MSRAPSQLSTPQQVLSHYWGYDSFRPCQLEIINDVLAGHDVLGLMPTGGGKSLTFQVPAMLMPGVTVVVTPLVSLMKDQVDNLAARGIRAAYLSASLRPAQVRLAYDRCMLGKARMLYVSPERLRVESFLAELRTWNVSLIVVDEAHCISQWGYDFRPSYLLISRLREIVGVEVPVLALTASATPAVAADIRRQLAFRTGNTTHTLSFDRSNLSYIVRHAPHKFLKLRQILENTHGTSIVYVRSRARTKEIAMQLQECGIDATFYHAGLDARVRAERQQMWKDGKVRVIVATNAFGMGIDKADVRVVAHMDVPPSLEEYYQEAGRAGRDGKPAFAVVIAGNADKATLTRRLNDSFPEMDFIRHVYERVGAFLEVAVGAGYECVYEFDIERFCQVYKLRPEPVRGALSLLSRAGYFEYCEDGQTRSRIVIDTPRHEIYGLALTASEDAVMLALLRRYTGILTEFVHIDETEIQAETGLDADTVYNALLSLNRRKVARYVPRKAIPYIYYTTSREATKYVALPDSVYADRRREAVKRMQAVVNFVFSETSCRSRLLLEYFGETDVSDCGRCDVCRERSRNARADDIEDIASDALSQMVRRYPGATIEQLANGLGVPMARVAGVLRGLVEDGSCKICGMRVYPDK